jgi:hypothetical protein
MTTRHLVVLDKSIAKPTRRELKSRRKPEVDLVSTYELGDVAPLVRTTFTDRKSVQWDTISLLFDGHRDEQTQHATVMGVDLHVDVRNNRFKTCAGNVEFQTLVRTLSAMIVGSGVAHRGIYLHALNLGPMSGWQQLLKPATDTHTQVYLSNAVIKNDEVGWNVEWGNKEWYDLSPDQRKHAKLHLFHKRKHHHRADGASSTFDLYLKYHNENRRSTRYHNENRRSRRYEDDHSEDDHSEDDHSEDDLS